MPGFNLAQSLSAGDYSGKIQNYAVDAAHTTLIAPGDVVTNTGEADAFGVAESDTAGTTGAMTGIVASVSPNYEGEQLSRTGLAALTAGEIQVSIDPLITYIVDVTNGPLTGAAVGLNANIINTAATNIGGMAQSNMSINATGVATTNTLPFNIVALLEDENGTLGNRVEVRLQNSTLSAPVTGV